jgi:hypothetical protein
MLRKALSAAGLVAVVAAGILVASAGAQTASRFTVVDVPKRITHHGTVTVGKLTKPGTRRVVVGHDRIKFNPKTGHARGVFIFPNGKIKAAGFLENSRVQVLGGTRAYNGVAGKVKIHKSHGNDTPLTFVLVR